jgi:hypothetical protein
MRERGQHADTQSLTLRNPPDSTDALLQCLQRRFGNGQQFTPGAIEAQPAPLPFKQRAADGPFELLDLLTDGTMGKMNLQGGSAQIL